MHCCNKNESITDTISLTISIIALFLTFTSIFIAGLSFWKMCSIDKTTTEFSKKRAKIQDQYMEKIDESLKVIKGGNKIDTSKTFGVTKEETQTDVSNNLKNEVSGLDSNFDKLSDLKK